MNAATAPLVDLIRAQEALRETLNLRLVAVLKEVLPRQGFKVEHLALRDLSHFPMPSVLGTVATKHGIRLDYLGQFTLSYEVLNRDGYAKDRVSIPLYQLNVETLLAILDYFDTYGHLLVSEGHPTYGAKEGPGKPNR
jgi:hypothetical protein